MEGPVLNANSGGRSALSTLLAPAVVVMNRLSYPGKFLLISLLFAVPLTLFLYFLLSASNENISFAQKEIDGARYLRPLRQLQEHVIESRLLAYDVTRGDQGRWPDLIRKQAEIDADCEALAAVDRDLGRTLRIRERIT
jgi:hypothetical protein